MSVRTGIVACCAALAVAACGNGPAAEVPATSPTTAAPVVASSAPSTASPPTTATADGTLVPAALAGLPRGIVRLGGHDFDVVIAADSQTRARGLMDVADLGPLDGMVFVWPRDTESTFWMKDTLLPLDIAWFDRSGLLVSRLAMDPCPAEPCPTYGAAGPYRYAVEMPAGTMPEPGADVFLELVEGF